MLNYDDIPETGIDAVKAYLDDAIVAAAAAHDMVAEAVFEKVRKEIEWIEVEGYHPVHYEVVE